MEWRTFRIKPWRSDSHKHCECLIHDCLLFVNVPRFRVSDRKHIDLRKPAASRWIQPTRYPAFSRTHFSCASKRLFLFERRKYDTMLLTELETIFYCQLSNKIHIRHYASVDTDARNEIHTMWYILRSRKEMVITMLHTHCTIMTHSKMFQANEILKQF